MLPGGARYFFTQPLLLLLLAADLSFLVAHVVLVPRQRTGQLESGARRQPSGKFQYAKWFACTALCAWAFARGRDALYLAWAALFFYFLLDDSQSSWSIAERLELAPAYGLRAKDFGELAVSAIAGVVCWD
jgi:hypothetical protein